MQPSSINSKLPGVGTTIFTTMTALANEHNAINLSQGFPDFDIDPELIELVKKHMLSGNNQYAPMQGVYSLREKISEKTSELYKAKYDPETEITITPGATEAIFAAITAVINKDDEVIVIEPAYDSYVPAILLNGGRPVFVKMNFPDYKINWDHVNKAINSNTRLIILNSPHNPTGSILSSEDIKLLKKIISDTDILLLSDEVYEHIIFDNSDHESLAGHPELSRRAFVISSFGKTYHATGWKIGYCLAPARLSAEFRKIHQFLTFSANTPIQHAYSEFMERKEVYRDLNNFYQQKRDRFLTLLKNSRFRPIPCRGTYFQTLDYSGISDETDTEFAKRLTVEHGVASIPISVFYHNKDDNRVLRFCFAKKDDTLKEASEKLCRI